MKKISAIGQPEPHDVVQLGVKLWSSDRLKLTESKGCRPGARQIQPNRRGFQTGWAMAVPVEWVAPAAGSPAKIKVAKGEVSMGFRR